jgi:hemolysin activation/secretion protein
MKTSLPGSFGLRLLTVLMAVSATAALAQSTPSADQLLRLEQERLRFEQERNQQRQMPSGVDLLKDRKAAPAAASAGRKGACFTVNQINVQGAQEVYIADMDAIKAKYLMQCLGANEIESLLGDLTAEYVSRGFVTTRAYLPEQDLKSGKMRVLVMEGRIERMQVVGDGADRINLDLAVPARAGDLLNIRDLEQAVDQINSARGNKVVMDLVPGSQPGKTVVMFKNTASNPFFAEATADNQGAVNTGKVGYGTTLKLGGGMGFNETLMLTARRTNPHEAEKSADSLGFNVSVPVGYTTYGFGVSQSNFSIGLPITNRASLLYLTGESTSYNLNVDRVLSRDQGSLYKGVLLVNSVNSKNYADGTLIQVSSRHSNSLSLGVNGTLNVAEGSLFVQPMMVMGLNGQSNLPVGMNQQSVGAQAEFTKYTLDANFNRDFKEWGQDMAWTSAFRGQYSSTELFTTQQMIIGGLPSVRGFVSSFLTGDTGFYWRNDLSLKKGYDFDGMAVQARYYAGYDYGRISSHDPLALTGRLSGYVFGLNLQQKNGSVDFQATKADHVPEGLSRESAHFYVRLTLNN